MQESDACLVKNGDTIILRTGRLANEIPTAVCV